MTAPTQTIPTQRTATPVDLVNPSQACDHLGVTEAGLLQFVNEGRLGAYNIGGHIRFRLAEVRAAPGLATAV